LNFSKYSYISNYSYALPTTIKKLLPLCFVICRFAILFSRAEKIFVLHYKSLFNINENVPFSITSMETRVKHGLEFC